MMKLKLWISLAIGAIALWLVLRNIHWEEVSQAFERIRAWPLFVVLFFMFLSHCFRIRRWTLFLKPIKENIGAIELFGINAVGFLAIHVLPLRLGEFTRPLLLKKRHAIPFSTGLATIALERVFDGLVAALALSIGVLATPVGFGEMPSIGVGLRAMAVFSLALFVPLLVFLFLAVLQRNRAIQLISYFTKFLPDRFKGHLDKIVTNFFEGLKSLPNVSSLLRIFFESLCVWGSMAIAYWAGFMAFQLDLPWSAPIALLGIVAMGVMLPAAPGFVGTFQFFVIAGLFLYGVPKEMGLAYSIVIHVLQLFYITAAGLIFLPKMATKMKSLMTEAQQFQ